MSGILYIDRVPLSDEKARNFVLDEGEGALYADNEAPLGVSDVGQVTISLSAVRGWGIINNVCFLILCVRVFMLTWHYTCYKNN